MNALPTIYDVVYVYQICILTSSGSLRNQSHVIPQLDSAEVVRSHDGLQLSLAVTLVMATLVALLRPYARAQA